jgi:hypothetical protein
MISPFANDNDQVFAPQGRKSPPPIARPFSFDAFERARTTMSASPVGGNTPLMIIEDAEKKPQRGMMSSSASPVKRRSKKSKASRQVEEDSKEPRQAPAVLRKTEICRLWKDNGSCVFGSSCMFAHGVAEIRSRPRPENFRTKVCEDISRKDRVCSYMLNNENRCNFAHPGEALRINMHREYLDQDYAMLTQAHGDDYPFGIYI